MKRRRRDYSWQVATLTWIIGQSHVCLDRLQKSAISEQSLLRRQLLPESNRVRLFDNLLGVQGTFHRDWTSGNTVMATEDLNLRLLRPEDKGPIISSDSLK